MDPLLGDVAALVSCESPSEDLAALAACARLAAEMGLRWLGAEPEWVLAADGRPHLLWRWGPRVRVLLLGHLDTVWPAGTLASWPFAVEGDRMTGPGVFDMKAGVVAAFAAVSRLEDRDGVAILLTTDEEIGSPTSRDLIESTARGARAALVLEAGVGSALKTARKGVSMYRLLVTGRAAHAGLEPEQGVNAAVELSHQIQALVAIADPAAGTTVTPTVLRAGTASNTVPAAGSVAVDVRAATAGEQQRVDAAIRRLAPVLPGTRLVVEGGPNRPPLEAAASAELFGLARAVAVEIGQPAPDGVAVGGGSDGNFTAAIGVPTLDGLGADGGHAHADGEWASVAGLARRVDLLTALLRRLVPEP